MKPNDLIETLASYEHDRWSRWQTHLHNQCIRNQDGTFTIPKEDVERWVKQIQTNYEELSEEEKEADRLEARRILEVFNNGKK